MHPNPQKRSRITLQNLVARAIKLKTIQRGWVQKFAQWCKVILFILPKRCVYSEKSKKLESVYVKY